jgi:hypothetical protein
MTPFRNEHETGGTRRLDAVTSTLSKLRAPQTKFFPFLIIHISISSLFLVRDLLELNFTSPSPTPEAGIHFTAWIPHQGFNLIANSKLLNGFSIVSPLLLQTLSQLFLGY